jgi:hypothetical protein
MGEARKLMAIPVADGHRASRICDYAAQILRKVLALDGPRRRNQGTLAPTVCRRRHRRVSAKARQSAEQIAASSLASFETSDWATLP